MNLHNIIVLSAVINLSLLLCISILLLRLSKITGTKIENMQHDLDYLYQVICGDDPPSPWDFDDFNDENYSFRKEGNIIYLQNEE